MLVTHSRGLALGPTARNLVPYDRRNLMPYSYDLTNWTTKTNVTIAANATGPTQLGATTASKITESTDGGAVYHLFSHAVGALAAGWYELIVVAKYLTANRAFFRAELAAPADAPTAGGWWREDTGAYLWDYASTWAVDGELAEAYSDSFTCCRLFVNVTAAAAAAKIQIMTDGGAANGSYQGDGSPVMDIAHVGLYRGAFKHVLQQRNG
jgi:hypothetical protein